MPDIKDELTRAVREEIRACGLMTDYSPSLPMPCDVEAEATVTGAVAAGEVAASELYGLASDDFHDKTQRYFYSKLEAAAIAQVKLTPKLLAASCAADGLNPYTMAPEIELLFARPVCFPDDARRAARRIIDCSRSRRLIEALGKLDTSLRVGERNYSQGIAALERLLVRARELET